jgi:hypothetical protein
MRIQDETRSHCPGRLQSILFDSYYCRGDPIMAKTLGFPAFLFKEYFHLGRKLLHFALCPL